MSNYHLEVIVYKNNNHAEYIKVSACGTGFWGGFTADARTDQNGRAVITTIHEGEYTVYVDGYDKGKFRSPGQAIIHI